MKNDGHIVNISTNAKLTVAPFDNANRDAIVFNVTDHSMYMSFIDKGTQL